MVWIFGCLYLWGSRIWRSRFWRFEGPGSEGLDLWRSRLWRSGSSGGPGSGSSGCFEVLCHVHTRFYINVEKLTGVSDLLFEFSFFHGFFMSLKKQHLQNQNITLQRPRQVTKLHCTTQQRRRTSSKAADSASLSSQRPTVSVFQARRHHWSVITVKTDQSKQRPSALLQRLAPPT